MLSDKAKRECPVPFPRGSWMGNHHFVYRPGTQVELGADGGYFCEYCSVSLDKINNDFRRSQRAKGE